MPRVGVSITKNTSFRGTSQEFSNVYYYEVTSLPSVAQADTMIDNITAYEKTFHSTLVTFVRGRCWSETGNKATSEMITQKNLSGAGARSLVTAMDKERAYLFRLRSGVDSRGNPVYLRKWYHSCGIFEATVTPSQPMLENTAGFTSGQRATMVGAMNQIGDAVGSANAPKICSKKGRLPNAGATWDCHQYLEHHQLGDMWRAQ